VRRGRVARCAAALNAVFRAADSFSLKHHVHEGEAAHRRSTPYGGACSAAAVVAVLTFAAVLVVRRQLDNVLVQESLAFHGKSAAAGGGATLGATGSGSAGEEDGTAGAADGAAPLREFAWATAGSIAGTELLLPPSSGVTVGGSAGAAFGAAGTAAAPATLPLSGVHVRVLAHGEPGACDAPRWWQAEGVGEGAGTGADPGSAARWRVLQGSVGAGDRAASRLLFACPGCELSATAALRFGLHYSCQSLVLQVGAVSANGSVTLVTAAPKDTAGSAGGGMLLRLDMAVAPVLGTRTAEAANDRTRGYELLPVSLAATRAAVAVPALLQPAAAEVVVAIALPLQPLFGVTVLSEKTSLVELLSSILALGGLFGIFAHVFAMSEGVLDDGAGHPLAVAARRWCARRVCGTAWCPHCCCGRGTGSAAAATSKRPHRPSAAHSKAGGASSSTGSGSGASPGGSGAGPGGRRGASSVQLVAGASAVQLASRTAFDTTLLPADAAPGDASGGIGSPASAFGSASSSAGPARAGALGRGALVSGPLSAAALASAASHRSLTINGGGGAAALSPADGAVAQVTVNPLHAAAGSGAGTA
jgi:hypothetical protein